MDSDTGTGPPPIDLDGWRQAVADGCFHEYRMEAIVAAVQDLGPTADKRVLNPLILHISDVILRILRRGVDRRYRNHGVDIITEVHARLVTAIHDPASKDGKGLRKAFVVTVEHRAIDEIRREKKKSEREIAIESDEGTAIEQAPDEYDAWQEINERIDVERILSLIPDQRKRDAFRLHMDRVPLESKRGRSIEKEVGVSAKTAGGWIEEVRQLLKESAEAIRLMKEKRGTNQ